MTPELVWKGLEARTLGKGDFHHEDHLKAAWHALGTWPLADAARRFVMAIRAFAAHHDVPGLYHETITLFYLYEIQRRRAVSSEDQDWDNFRADNPDLMDHRSLMARHYEAGMLDTEFARHHFLPPSCRGLRDVSRLSPDQGRQPLH